MRDRSAAGVDAAVHVPYLGDYPDDAGSQGSSGEENRENSEIPASMNMVMDGEPMTDRKELHERYRALVAAVKRAIDDADPIGLLQLGAPADEYSPEVGTIVPRVSRAASPAEVTRILHEEFTQWFGVEIAGREDSYQAPALRIWRAVLVFKRECG